jgi:putative spermidine/putrescine transport system ATP-binding protein/spermidine/putrescine transport system ATP-binding protein
MQSELVDLRRRLGMTFIYITHSQEEALTMSDRIVLMRRGRIEQSGAPVDLFDRPVSRFVAEFMGFENFLTGTVTGLRGDEVRLSVGGSQVMTGVCAAPVPPAVGQAAVIAFRAERVNLVADQAVAPAGSNVLACHANERLYRGKYLDHSIDTALGRIKVRSWDRNVPAEVGAVAWRPEDSVVMAA